LSRQFTADKITLNKKEVRERLYDDVRDLLPQAKAFGMLAGEVPEEEIGVIHRRFYRPDITAFDINRAGVDAAAACGIVAVHGNLNYEKTFTGRQFDFFDLDLCKTLVTSRKLIQKVAAKTNRALAVFVSYRDGTKASAEALDVLKSHDIKDNQKTEACQAADHKRVKTGKTTSRVERVSKPETTIALERVNQGKTTKQAERAKSAETAKLLERVTDLETTKPSERVSDPETTMWIERVSDYETTSWQERVKSEEITKIEERANGEKAPNNPTRLTNAQLGRVILMHQCVLEVRPNAQIVRAYAYRGNAGMMLGVLFAFGKKPIEQLPPFCTVSEEATFERHYRLRSLGVGGTQLRTRLRNGQREAVRKTIPK
jgi:hypothetical protein